MSVPSRARALLAISILACHAGLAISQESAPEQQAEASAGQRKVLAVGMHNSGKALAEVSAAIRDGTQVTIKVRFRPVGNGLDEPIVLYDNLTERAYQTDFYLLAGNRKYLLLKDTEDRPLAPSTATINAGDAMYAGSWYGVFPAPPVDENVMLFLQDVEPLGPFLIPAQD